MALARSVEASRLVTITGSPGVGKSALASELARTRRHLRCELEAARTADDVTTELARVLGLTRPDDVARAIAARRETLFLLDDVDRVRAPLAKLLRRWLRGSPAGVRFLVTARGRLGVPGEQVAELGPLEVPRVGETDPDVIARFPAVMLFARIGATVAPGFQVTAANARTVATIVRELEGNPLAIELCASRLRALSEADLASLLSSVLDLLEDERGERSVRSAFALSWEELTPQEAKLLAACSVFRGGFTLEAACAVSGGPRLAVARGLERLVEASLVRTRDGRFTLAETLRVFAAEKLGAHAAASARHARWYAALRERSPRLDQLVTERRNLEAAFETCIGVGDARAASVLLSYAPIPLARGPLGPFVDRVTRALDETKPSAADRAELLYARGVARIFLGRRDDAEADLEKARAGARRAGRSKVEALATSRLGVVRGFRGEVEEALALFEDALAAAIRARDPRTEGVVRKDLANVLSEAQRNDDAVIELGRARRSFRAAGDVREEGFVLMMLGSRFLDDGRLGEARRDLDAALLLIRSAGDVRTEGWALTMLALVDAEEGHVGPARASLGRALEIVREVGDELTEGLVLGYLGGVALEQGLLAEAESSYQDAIVRVARAGDRASEGLFTAALAMVEYLLGRRPAARDGFDRALALLHGAARPARREAALLLASVLSGEPPATTKPELEEVRFARRVLSLAASRPAAARAPSLVVASDGSWVTTEAGHTVRFGRERPITRVLARLAVERVRDPGRSLPLQTLVRAGWPGERVLPAAAKNRLHVTIARLRRVLALQSGVDGYRLDPKTAMRLAEPGEVPSGALEEMK